MSMRLHHVNLTSLDAKLMGLFYQRALGLRPNDIFARQLAVGTDSDGRPFGDQGGSAAYELPIIALEAGDEENLHLHLSTIDNTLAHRMNHWVNPLGAAGHFAFRTDDIEAAKRRLDEAGIPYSDYGTWAFRAGRQWYQIFFADPMGNVVEVHQVMD